VIDILDVEKKGAHTTLHPFTPSYKAMSEENVSQITPTQGFNVKRLLHDGFHLNMWDIGG
jgi:hypothetical protein